jgi:hypothetical protein
VVDGNLASSRGPQDFPAFNQERFELFAPPGQ